MPTIKDVAAAAGVSVSTVSNLLNGRVHLMQPDTRARVDAVIKELGYRPNRLARQLREGQGPSFGLLVPSVANPFWGAWAAHLEAAATARGQQVFLCNTDRDPSREAAYVEQLRSYGVDRFVLSTSVLSLEHVREAIASGVRIVAFDRETATDDPEGLRGVSVDNVEGARLATAHLIELGHRRIGFITGALTTISRRARLAGYRQALTDASILFDDELVSQSPDLGDTDSSARGREAAAALLRLTDPPTAIVAINDMMALGAYAGVRDRGRDVPDISVVGFDDIPIAELMSPGLTTIRQPLEAMADATLALLDGTADDSRTFSPTLVARGSTRRPALSTTAGGTL